MVLTTLALLIGVIATMVVIPSALVRRRSLSPSPRAVWNAVHHGPAAEFRPDTAVELELMVQQRTRELFAANLRLEQVAGELDQARREADAQRYQAEKANSAKSAFLANVSHELRTPLNAIMGFSEIIQKEIFGSIHNVRYRDYARDIHDAAELLQSLINDILDLSKIEANKYELHSEWLDLNAVLGEPLRLIRDRASHNGIVLVDEFDVVSPQLHADRRALKQMVLNLLSNAIKFTSPNGRVVLRSRLLATGEVTVEVEDTGCGIPKEQLGRVLLPFEQVDNAHTRSHQGTGLGLPLVKALVGLHEGALDITSEMGNGTKMSLRFPAMRVALDAKLEEPPAEMCA